MKYNSRAEYQGGAFYLLNLVEADYPTLLRFVQRMEEEDESKVVSQPS